MIEIISAWQKIKEHAEAYAQAGHFQRWNVTPCLSFSWLANFDPQEYDIFS